MNRFTVKVPASTSNLGPGFDTIGLALNLYNEYSFELLPAGAESTLEYSSNLPDTEVPYTKDNLVYRAFDYVFKRSKNSCSKNFFSS